MRQKSNETQMDWKNRTLFHVHYKADRSWKWWKRFGKLDWYMLNDTMQRILYKKTDHKKKQRNFVCFMLRVIFYGGMNFSIFPSSLIFRSKAVNMQESQRKSTIFCQLHASHAPKRIHKRLFFVHYFIIDESSIKVKKG